MYIPRGWHFLGPVSVILIGFVIHEHFNGAWEVIVFVNAPLAPIAWEWARYIHHAGVVYQKYLAGTKEDAPVIKTEASQAPVNTVPGFKPLVRSIQPAYAQTTELPAFDKERSFAVTLIRMYDFDPATVDLREVKWVKTGKFSRGPFVAMLDNWKAHGIIDRENENKNSRYVVVKWPAVRLIAQGHPLPPIK